MKYWLAVHGYDYEPQSVIGIFSTQEKAIEACESLHAKSMHKNMPLEWSNGVAVFYSQYYDVTAYELDKNEFDS